jgi:hypothetical protein
MFSQEIKLQGHIIDSLILPKVLDEILSRGGKVLFGTQRNEMCSGPSWNSGDAMLERSTQRASVFEFMASNVSIEKPKRSLSANSRRIPPRQKSRRKIWWSPARPWFIQAVANISRSSQ